MGTLTLISEKDIGANREAYDLTIKKTRKYESQISLLKGRSLNEIIEKFGEVTFKDYYRSRETSKIPQLFYKIQYNLKNLK